MLDAANELGIVSDVSDEGGYWDNRNIEELTKTIHDHNVLIAGFAGQLKDKLAADNITFIEASIFDYPNFEYLEADSKDS